MQLLQHRIDRNAAKARIGINDAYGVFFWPYLHLLEDENYAKHLHFLENRNYAEQAEFFSPWRPASPRSIKESWKYMKIAKKLREENDQLRARIEELEQHTKEIEQAKQDVRLSGD